MDMNLEYPYCSEEDGTLIATPGVSGRFRSHKANPRLARPLKTDWSVSDGNHKTRQEQSKQVPRGSR